MSEIHWGSFILGMIWAIFVFSVSYSVTRILSRD